MKTKDFESIKITHAENGVHIELRKVSSLDENPIQHSKRSDFVFTSMIDLYEFLIETIEVSPDQKPLKVVNKQPKSYEWQQELD